jgi:hypothetical protein
VGSVGFDTAYSGGNSRPSSTAIRSVRRVPRASATPVGNSPVVPAPVMMLALETQPHTSATTRAHDHPPTAGRTASPKDLSITDSVPPASSHADMG